MVCIPLLRRYTTLTCHFFSGFTPHFNQGTLNPHQAAGLSPFSAEDLPIFSTLLPTLIWGLFSFPNIYLWSFSTKSYGYYSKLLLFPHYPRSLFSHPHILSHTPDPLHTRIFPLFIPSWASPRPIRGGFYSVFLYTQRYITLFLPILFSAEGFSGNYYPFFSQILYYSPTPTPRLIRSISTAYPRIISISPRLF